MLMEMNVDWMLIYENSFLHFMSAANTPKTTTLVIRKTSLQRAEEFWCAHVPLDAPIFILWFQLKCNPNIIIFNKITIKKSFHSRAPALTCILRNQITSNSITFIITTSILSERRTVYGVYMKFFHPNYVNLLIIACTRITSKYLIWFSRFWIYWIHYSRMKIISDVCLKLIDFMCY